MKKAILAVAVLGVISASAFADTTYSGTVSGVSGITTNGQSIAGSYVNGSGYSQEHADSASFGSASIGGSVTPEGSTVSTSVYSDTTTHASGFVSEGQPGIEGGTIYNGAVSFGSTFVSASGNATFATAGVSPVPSIDNGEGNNGNNGNHGNGNNGNDEDHGHNGHNGH